MSIINLTPQLVKSLSCPKGKAKTNILDSHCNGLKLEVRSSGARTYYLCDQDYRGKPRQIKLADALDVTLAQARQLATNKRAQIAMGEDPTNEKSQIKEVPTVEEFIETRYLPFVKSYKNSWITDEGLLKNHVTSVWGKRRMDEITTIDVNSLITKHRETHAPGSCNRLLILLRYLFNLALRWETPCMKANPAAGYRLMEENNKNERYLSKEEAATLYEVITKSPNTMLRYIIPMLILTGARKREVLDAKWEDFDLERQAWRIPISRSGTMRHVPLSDGAISLLKSIPIVRGCEYPFANPKSLKPYISIFCSWDTARTRAGLADVRIHDLRHSFASFLINGGRSLYEVQKILGHTQISTTQRYAHLGQDSLISAANIASFCMPLLPMTAP